MTSKAQIKAFALRRAAELGFALAGVATAGAAVFGKTYRYAPISSLYALGRPQDAGLQKARWNIHQRNHIGKALQLRLAGRCRFWRRLHIL